MKKCLVFVLSCIIMLACSSGLVLGSELALESSINNRAELEFYAYMDLGRAPKAIEERILRARHEIIYSSEGWAADDVVAYIIDFETGEEIERIPSFSEIFPADWDLPVDKSIIESDSLHLDIPEHVDRDNVINSSLPLIHRQWHRLPVPPANTMSPNFHTFPRNGRSISGTAVQLFACDNYNIGFTNANTGVCFLHRMNLRPGNGVRVDNVSASRIGVRASTHTGRNNMAEGLMEVRNDAAIWV